MFTIARYASQGARWKNP